jgi:autotransporter strand-loop-strand O-heptosyltransferase
MEIKILDIYTRALGDNIAYFPYIDLYQKKTGYKLYVRTAWKNLFKNENPNVELVDVDFQYEGAEVLVLPYIFKETCIQKTACDILGLEYKELKPEINHEKKYNFNKKNKYVCLSMQSTLQMKYWNLNNGWEKIIKWLKQKGYDVYCIDRDEIFGSKEKWNHMPKGAYNETGNYPIEYRIEQIKNCEFFIGISSGLSWLAWALNKKVVMVSGCTNAENEFQSDCYRVINNNVCHGCLNDSSIDNSLGVTSSWLYCPRQKNFECTKSISVDDVKEKINQCISDLKILL